MSTAILYSGQFRTFPQCFPTQWWHVLRHYEAPHLFILLERDGKERDFDFIYKRIPKERVFIRHIEPPTLPEIPIEAGMHAPYFNSVPHWALQRQHFYQYQVWQMFEQTRPHADFDVFIRCRTDNFFHGFDPVMPRKGQAVTPFFGKFGGLNDRFAVIGADAAKAYFSVHQRIDGLLALGCPFHPETLLKETLRSQGVAINDTHRAFFSTLREPQLDEKTGQHIQQIRPMELTAQDWADFHAGIAVNR